MVLINKYRHEELSIEAIREETGLNLLVPSNDNLWTSMGDLYEVLEISWNKDNKTAKFFKFIERHSTDWRDKRYSEHIFFAEEFYDLFDIDVKQVVGVTIQDIDKNKQVLDIVLRDD